MATLSDILQAKQPDIWAQLMGQAGSQGAPTPGPAVTPNAPPPAPVATAPTASPTLASLPPITLQHADPADLAAVTKAAAEAADIASRRQMAREGAENFRQVGGNAYQAPNISDLEAARKAPLEAYARREAARQQANKDVLEQITGQKNQAESLNYLAKPAEAAATLAEAQRAHDLAASGRAASTAATIQDTDTRVKQQAYDRNLQRELKARELAQDKARWDADRAAKEKMLQEKLAALGTQAHNARASGLAKQAAALDAAIADTDAQYQAVKDAGGTGRAAGIASGALEAVPLVGHAAANALFPKSTALRGGASAETESTATAVGGGAATQPRMTALAPLAYDPSLSTTALNARHDVKTQRLKGRREDLQREAASLGINLDTKHGGGGQAATHYKYNGDPATATMRIPTDAAGNELGPPEKNQ